MSGSTLRDWLRRAMPPRRRLVEAASLSVLAAAASIALLGGSGLLIGKAAGRGGLAALGVLLVFIELVAFLRAPLRYEERVITHRVALGSMVRWRSWLYDTVAQRLPGSLSSSSSGELLDRALEDVDALEDLWVRLALPVFGAAATSILGVAIVAILVPSAGLVLAAGVILGALCALGAALGADRDAEAEARWRGIAAARTVDLVVGLSELTMATGADASLGQIADAERRRGALARRAGLRRGVGLGMTGLLGGLAVLGVVLCCAHAAHRGEITAAEAAGLSLVAVATVEPLAGLVMAALRAPEVAASGARLDELEAAPIAAPESAAPSPWPVGEPLMLHHVAAPATVGGPLVLRDVSLEVAPGERIALLGASGAGKSTICALLLRFLDPERGSISIGTAALDSLGSEELRRHIALLDQSPVLFGGTIADALRLGDPAATDDDLRAALELVDLGELGASSLEMALAEAGSSLSRGQQRRLALARVLLRRPTVLLLDEPTAGLDERQGADVLRRSLDAAPGAAVILLTHRVAETEGFDRVYVLDDGVLSELGAPERAALSS
jgi:thiol reductant ABC exporter CydC subunit